MRLPPLPVETPDQLRTRRWWRRVLAVCLLGVALMGLGLMIALYALFSLDLVVAVATGGEFDAENAVASPTQWAVGWGLVQIGSVLAVGLLPFWVGGWWLDLQGGYQEWRLRLDAMDRADSEDPVEVMRVILDLDVERGGVRPEHVLQFLGTRPPVDRERGEALREELKQVRLRAEEALRKPGRGLRPQIAQGGRDYDPAELAHLCDEAREALWDWFAPRSSAASAL